MKNIFVALILSMSGFAPAWADDAAEPVSPILSEERVVFQTSQGDIILALHTDTAPQHIAQFLKLVRAGVYNHTAITFIDPSYYIQVGTVNDRVGDLNDEQKALVGPIPQEFNISSHKKGMISFSLIDDKPGSAESSFTILRGDAPHLDRKSLVFGQVVDSEETLLRLERTPTKDLQPLNRVEIVRADVLTKEEAVARKSVTEQQITQTTQINFALAAFVAILLISVGGFFLKTKLNASMLRSLNMVNAFVASFAILALFTPMSRQSPILGSCLFFGMVALFKLMNRFEST